MKVYFVHTSTVINVQTVSNSLCLADVHTSTVINFKTEQQQFVFSSCAY